MKIIDLLNKIANGEELPKKIFCFNREFYLEGNTYFGDTFTLMHYIQEEDLNDKIAILEEEKKIPEKIKDYSVMKTMGLDCEFQERKISKDFTLEEIVYKINEIIDYLDYLKSKGDE